MHIKYPKIKRLGDEDNDGILMGTVHVQEKVDGANASIWFEDNWIRCGSRSRVLKEGFNGFVDYVHTHEGIKKLMTDHPDWRLYGEWLVRHTMQYDETAYKQFYLFDILVISEAVEEPEELEGDKYTDKQRQENRTREIVKQGTWMNIDMMYKAAAQYGILTPELFDTLTDPSADKVQEYVGKTTLGEKGEGIVLKNAEFINKWGDRVCAKIVTQEFKEDNGITFGGNNKHSETYIEMKMVNEFMTIARVKKIMNKLQPEFEQRLGRDQTGRIISTSYHDMFEEEIWKFAKKHKKIDFGHLQKLACKKAAKIYHDILDGHESVAYGEKDNS